MDATAFELKDSRPSWYAVDSEHVSGESVLAAGQGVIAAAAAAAVRVGYALCMRFEVLRQGKEGPGAGHSCTYDHSTPCGAAVLSQLTVAAVREPQQLRSCRRYSSRYARHM